MAINRINGKLSYAKASDETWTMVDSRYGPYKDITYYKGRFYAVNLHCIVMACYIRDSDNTSEAEQAVAELPPHSSFTNQYYCKFYIVESAGALLIVSRAISTNYAYGTFGFKVFKVDLSSNKCMEIKDYKVELINALLVDAETKQLMDDHEAVKKWLDELQDLAYDADDMLDEYATQALTRKLKIEQHQASTSMAQKLMQPSNTGIQSSDAQSLDSVESLFDDKDDTSAMMIDITFEF
ncbi:hypothetical protein QYF36_004814 [Acer negundo]|nr:hypothetical protein QYF36_004814 [Acer negundo]